MQLFYDCVSAPTIAEFDSLRMRIAQISPEIDNYLSREWWMFKTMIVSAWTNQYTHFKLTETSRVEGAHSVIKKWLGSSQSDVLTLVTKLNTYWNLHIHKVCHDDEMASQVTIPYSLQTNIFQDCVRLIHRFALTETEKLLAEAKEILRCQRLDLRSNRKPCTRVYQKVTGRPCVHVLTECLTNNTRLRPSHFDIHWWIDRGANPPLLPPAIHEPTVLHRSKRKGKKNLTGSGPNGTRREPSRFERTPARSPIPPEMLHSFTVNGEPSTPTRRRRRAPTASTTPIPTPNQVLIHSETPQEQPQRSYFARYLPESFFDYLPTSPFRTNGI